MSIWCWSKFNKVLGSSAIGSIPILLADNSELPNHDLWKDSILEVKEKDVKIPQMLENISIEKKKK